MIQKTNILLNNIAESFRKYPSRYIVFGACFVIFTIVLAIFWPLTISFSYDGKRCIYQPTIAPGLLRSTSDSYRLEADRQLRVGGVALAAMQMCVMPLKPPQQGLNTVRLSVVGVPFLQKTYTIVVDDPPRVSVSALSKKPISLSRALSVTLSAPDSVFSYKAAFTNDKVASCDREGHTLQCPIDKLQLKQGEKYRLRIDRYFNEKKVATVAEQEVRTLTATRVTGSSVGSGQTVYAKLKSIELTTDKEVAGVGVRLMKVEGDMRKTVPIVVQYKDRKVTVSWKEDLARQSKFELVVDKITGRDGSGLDDVYALPFEVSGGPKVKNISVGNYRIPLGSTITITFDQPLLASQDIKTAVSATAGARVVGMKGAQVFVSFIDVPRCTDVVLSVSNALQSEHGVTGGSTWHYSTRTICQVQSIIGSSVKGRSIVSYSFGDGAETILYTGAIHGDEVSTRALMLRWIDELEASPRAIPAGKKVVVIPTVNPDGVAVGTRTNANNVDLNRNFATADWKSDITTTSNTPFPGGGGQFAMSEPEVQAIAGLVSRLRPQLILSYHSIGSLLAANQIGSSNLYASIYARTSGYLNTTGASDVFEYGISGTADDYYGQVLGVPSILIELGSHTYHQFERNREAMWAMIR